MSDPLHIRTRSMTEIPISDEGDIQTIASTDEPVDMGDYVEILSHAPGAIDTSLLDSLLVEHDLKLVVGGVRNHQIDGHQMTTGMHVDEAAKLPTGISVRSAVKQKYLRSVSIGYTYNMKDVTVNRATRTVTVHKWQARELSLTPVGKDQRARFRSFSDFTNPTNLVGKPQEAIMPDEIKPGDKPAADETARAKEIADARQSAVVASQRSADVVQITKLAESYDLKASEFLDAAKFPSLDKAIDGMITEKATRSASHVKANVGNAIVHISQDAVDKARSAAVDSMSALGGFMDKKTLENIENGFSMLEIAKRHAKRSGLDPSDWTKLDTAQYILGKKVPGARAANVTSSNFNNVVLGNYMDKEVFNGFNNFASAVTYPIWTRRKSVADFKTFGIGSLDTGNLISTGEDLPFPEIAKAEGYYTAALGLWGATISLTFQALVNDDLGEFAAMLNRAGAIAQRTIDKNVYDTVNAATWTSNTTSAVAGLTAAGMSLLRAAFDIKTGPAGALTGNTMKYVLVPSCLRTAALQVTTQVQAYPTATNVNTDITAVVTPYLTQAGTPSQSTVYAAADPRLADTVTVGFLQGMETPQVAEYDAGAVASRKWKIMQAFVSALATTTVGGTIFIPGMQQGTN